LLPYHVIPANDDAMVYREAAAGVATRRGSKKKSRAMTARLSDYCWRETQIRISASTRRWCRRRRRLP
jgi:hypothetical protein